MKRHSLLILACALALGGCVSSSKFKGEQKRAETLDQELKAAKAAADESSKKAAAAETDLRTQLQAGADQLASANVQIASLQSSNKDLQKSLAANTDEQSRKIASLIKEKDAISQKLANTSKDLAAATARATAAEADKAALEKAKAEELAKVRQNYDNLTATLKSEIAAGEVTITQLKGKLTVNMVDRILFDSGQAEVRSDGKKVLEKVGQVLAGVADKDIRIEGHTDNKPIVGELRNKYATNWELSTARATAVLRHLQDTVKLDGKTLVAAGYGEFRPVSPNDTPEQRALNRRIEIVLVPRD
jgi:chemotaxis protein MotB